MEEQTKLDSNENMENNVIHLGPPEGYVQQELESNPQKAEETYETQNTGKESLENPVDNIKKKRLRKKNQYKISRRVQGLSCPDVYGFAIDCLTCFYLAKRKYLPSLIL